MKEVSPDDKWTNMEDEVSAPEAQGENVEEAEDLFSPKNIGIVQTITLLRIYDILMAEFMDSNPAAASRMLERHKHGGTFTPPPAFDPEQMEDYDR